MVEAETALWNVLESPTEIGSAGILGPIPPASNMINESGAWVLCANMQAIMGNPVPAKNVFPFSSRCEATHASNSVEVNSSAYFMFNHLSTMEPS